MNNENLDILICDECGEEANFLWTFKSFHNGTQFNYCATCFTHYVEDTLAEMDGIQERVTKAKEKINREWQRFAIIYTAPPKKVEAKPSESVYSDIPADLAKMLLNLDYKIFVKAGQLKKPEYTLEEKLPLILTMLTMGEPITKEVLPSVVKENLARLAAQIPASPAKGKKRKGMKRAKAK